MDMNDGRTSLRVWPKFKEDLKTPNADPGLLILSVGVYKLKRKNDFYFFKTEKKIRVI